MSYSKIANPLSYDALREEVKRLRQELDDMRIHLGAIVADNGGRIEVPNILLFQDYVLTVYTDNDKFATVIEVEDR